MVRSCCCVWCCLHVRDGAHCEVSEAREGKGEDEGRASEWMGEME